MHRSLIALTLFLSTFSVCGGQTPYALKGDAIGESIQTYRQLHRGVIPPYTGLAGYRDYLRCTGDTSEPPTAADPEPQPPKKPRTGMLRPEATESYQKAEAEWSHAYLAWKDRAAAAQALADSRADVRKQFLAHEPEDRVDCSLNTTIADVPTKVLYTFISNRLDSISAEFAGERFEQVRDAIISKYGAPTGIETRRWVNLAGARLPYEVLEWIGVASGSAISLTEATEEANISRLTIFNLVTRKALSTDAQKKANADF